MRLVVNALVLFITTAACFLCMEFAVRKLDGYELFTPRLTLASAAKTRTADDVAADRARSLVAGLPLAAGVDSSWFDQSPAPYAEQRGYPELLTRLEQAAAERGGSEVEATYVWNSNWLKQVGCATESTRDEFNRLPRQLLTFTAPGNDIYPTYRLTHNFTWGGSSVNRFGFRGPDIDFKKPPATIRVAIMGSSTVMDSPTNEFSYPELAVNYLNVWAARTGRKVKFEVINGGRSGVEIQSIEKIITREVLPLRPDLVIFDGTAQGIFPISNLKLEGEASLDAMKAQIAARRAAVLGHGLAITDWSAIARRIYFAAHQNSDNEAELPKPKQSLIWPAGVNVEAPDPDAASLPFGLSDTVAALDRVRAEGSKVGAELAVMSGVWLVKPGLKLDVVRNADIFDYLNRTVYPLSLDSLHRVLQFENRTFADYAQKRGIPYLDVQSAMPVDADLFLDATHTNQSGSRIKAWILFNALLPVVAAKLDSGAWPQIGTTPALSETDVFPEPVLSDNPCRKDADRADYIATGAPLFSLTTAPNYKAGTAATKVQQDADGLLVTSDQSDINYQLLSDPIRVEPGKNYILSYAFDMLRGHMTIGVLSVQEDQFLVSRPLDKGPVGSAPFRAQSGTVRIVLANANAGAAVSQAKLRKVEVFEAAVAASSAEH